MTLVPVPPQGTFGTFLAREKYRKNFILHLPLEVEELAEGRVSRSLEALKNMERIIINGVE